jgi:hypothetical protein
MSTDRNNFATIQMHNDTIRPSFLEGGGLHSSQVKGMIVNKAHEKPPRRRSRIVKILIFGVLLFIVVEPIVMYRTLQHQRESRQGTRQIVELIVSP